jgi:hypothetical protein
MAAMGAQAASQIEGNRMMQETVQRGMKGVEDFAARRQLAAARVQLGELKLTDPDYGQKLSGLVMDNPLAFTNEKTAGVANFAFKQASDSYLAKEKIKAESLSRYQDYRYALDLAQMRMVGDQSLASKQNARYAADVFRSKSAVLTSNLKNIDDALLTARPEDLPYLQSERAKIQGELGSVNTEYETSLNQSIEPSAVNMREPLGAPPLPGQEVPMDNEVLSPGLSTQQNLNASLFPGVVEGPNTPPFLSEEENLPPLMSAMSSETAAPISPSDIQYSEPMQNLRAPVTPAASAAPVPPMAPTAPVAPAATAQPSASFTPEQIAASRQAFYESQSKKSSSSAQPGKMTQSSIDALVRVTPAVNQAQVEYDNMDTQLKILDNQIKETSEFSADTTKLKADREALLKALPAAKNKLELFKAASELKLSEFGTAQEALDFLRTEEAIQQDKLKRAEVATGAAAGAPAAAAPAAGAGTTPETPKPPVELNFFEKALLEEAPAKKKEFEESGNQWTSAKQSIRGALGTGENGLEKIALEVFKADILGKGLPFVRARLIERIANEVGGRIPQGTKNAPIKFGLTDKAFSQKSERLGPQAVTWYEVVGAMADDLINQYEKAQIGANASTTNTSLENKNPSLGAVSAIPVP